MSVGNSRFTTLNEDGLYRFDAASRRVLNGDTQVYTAEITVATVDETFLGEREYVVRLLEVDTPERDADYEGWKRAVDWVKNFLTEQDDQGKTVPIGGGRSRPPRRHPSHSRPPRSRPPRSQWDNRGPDRVDHRF